MHSFVYIFSHDAIERLPFFGAPEISREKMARCKNHLVFVCEPPNSTKKLLGNGIYAHSIATYVAQDVPL